MTLESGLPEHTADLVATRNGKRIVFLILDGLGDLPFDKEHPSTPLEIAKKPNINRLLSNSCCGLFDPVEPGITPGSGPGHLALFGYDPRRHVIGRGVLEALGIDFPLGPDDVAARFNFCTLDKNRLITDRRAGRLSDAENRRVVDKLTTGVKIPGDVEVMVRSVSEHRGLVVLRGGGLGGRVTDTDPQNTGVAPLPAIGFDSPSERSAQLLNQFVGEAERVLKDEKLANGLLLRGIDKRPAIASLQDRFKLNPIAIATYPMYRGLARLVGMTVLDPPKDLAATMSAPAAVGREHDFLFVHVKYTDKAGEDGDYHRKVEVIEEVDGLLPELMKSGPDVLVITGDHSTPASMKSHSWHPVPVLLYAPGVVRPDGTENFTESDCRCGGLGRLSMRHLMPVALAHAMKLAKFGA